MPKSSLHDHISGRIDAKAAIGRKPQLPQDLESTIAEKVKKAVEKEFGISPRNLMIHTAQVIEKLKTSLKDSKPSYDWYQGFQKRHPGVRLRKSDKLSTTRSKMLNPTVIDQYFSGLKEIME